MYDVIIIGLGPAGLLCALNIFNKKVLIIEKNKRPGRKLILTGGGRCNVTNLKDNNLFLKEVNYNLKYLYSAINNFGPHDIYNYFNDHGILLKEELDNKIFPVSNKSTDILDFLVNEVNRKDFDILYDEVVLSITNNDIKEVVTNKGIYKTKNIVVATGGASFKHTGSNGDHMMFAKMINQPTKELSPAEVGIILKGNINLAGTSLYLVEVSYKNLKSRGNLIYTHKGLSGTSIMKISEFMYNDEDKNLYLDLLPDLTIEKFQSELELFDKNKEINNFLNNYFSKRFSTYLLEKLNLNNIKIKSLTIKDIKDLFFLLKKLSYEIKQVDSLDNAYVTKGGIDLNYIDTTTMESNINKGIYFVGESLDIHGPIGGYNITLAMSTGALAGKSIK